MSTRSGSRETEVNALAVIAWSMPSTTVVVTVTPVAKRAMARRKRETSEGSLKAGWDDGALGVLTLRP
jgi:hypothetical protein